MPRVRNDDPTIESESDVATGASPGPQEEAREAEAQEAAAESSDKEETFTLPAEDEGASLVRPGIGMEDVPTPDTQPDPEDYNEAVFAKKREAWEKANPEAVQQNKDRDAAHEEGKPYQPDSGE